MSMSDAEMLGISDDPQPRSGATILHMLEQLHVVQVYICEAAQTKKSENHDLVNVSSMRASPFTFESGLYNLLTQRDFVKVGRA
jgi:hypothetical protein